MCYGTEGTLVPAGALARSSDNRQYSAEADIVVSRSRAGDCDIIVGSVQDSTAYVMQVNATPYSYTSSAAATTTEILQGLAALFNPAQFLVTVVEDVLTIRAADSYSSFTLAIDTKLTMKRLASPGTFIAVELGKYPLPIAALNKMDTSVLGWSAISNLIAGATGSNVETDEELRRRHLNQGYVNGTATVLAMKSRLENDVLGVSSALVYENRSHNFVDGMPPHSVECVVSGGLDQTIADKVFEVKPAGIETYGNITLTVIDPNGDAQICKFSRPVTIYGWISVEVVSLYDEEMLTTDLSDAIVNAVLEYAATLGVGEDIIPQRIYGFIFAMTTGLAELNITCAKTALATDTPTYASDVLPIERAELAEITADRITVTGI
jgi:hypothetical protein